MCDVQNKCVIPIALTSVALSSGMENWCKFPMVMDWVKILPRYPTFLSGMLATWSFFPAVVTTFKCLGLVCQLPLLCESKYLSLNVHVLVSHEFKLMSSRFVSLLPSLFMWQNSGSNDCWLPVKFSSFPLLYAWGFVANNFLAISVNLCQIFLYKISI